MKMRKRFHATLKRPPRTSLGVPWLRLHIPNAGGLGSIPGRGTRFHMLQLRVHVLQLQIPYVSINTRCSQINKYIRIKTKRCLHMPLILSQVHSHVQKDQRPISNSHPYICVAFDILLGVTFCDYEYPDVND